MLNRQDFDQINKTISYRNEQKRLRKGQLRVSIVVLVLISLITFAVYSVLAILSLLGIALCIFGLIQTKYEPLYTREQWMRDKAQQEATMQQIRGQVLVGMQGSSAALDSRYIPDTLRQAILARDQHRCRACGSQSYLELDHVIPLSRGGATSFENLQVLCRRCNSLKGAR